MSNHIFCGGVMCVIIFCPTLFSQTGDFNEDGTHNCQDMELLQTAIREGSQDPRFQGYSQYGWLEEAQNSLGYEIRKGDFNMDGAVDFYDGNIIAINLFLESSGWCQGDLDGNLVTDLLDRSHVGTNWQLAAPPRETADVVTTDVSPTVAWREGAAFAETELFELVAFPQKAPAGFFATVLAARMLNSENRFSAIDHFAIRGDLHQVWPSGGLHDSRAAAQGVPAIGPFYAEEWIPYDSHLLIEQEDMMVGFGANYNGITASNDGSDPTNTADSLPLILELFPPELGIGDIAMDAPSDIFALKHDVKSDFINLAYVVTPALMPETGAVGNVGVTIGLLGATSDGDPLSSAGVLGRDVPISIPFFFTACDFDMDGDCGVPDLDQLLSAFGTNETQFDLNGDNAVNLLDVDSWLGSAQQDGQVLVRGDTNLDGKVDAADINELAKNWLIPGDYGWGGGDFDGNGVADAWDLNVIGSNWLHGVSFSPPRAIPEPKSTFLLLIVVLFPRLPDS